MQYDPKQTGVDVEAERRRVLWQNGYAPLPLAPRGNPKEDGSLGAKACRLSGWTSVIDHDELDMETTIAKWGAQSYAAAGTDVRSQTTGVLIREGLLSIDLDIDDASMIDKIFDLLIDVFPDRHTLFPIRTGGGEKLTLFARRGPGALLKGKYASPLYLDPETGNTHALEVFDGTGRHQAGVSGVRSYKVTPGAPSGVFTPAPVLEVETVYNWLEGRTLFDTPFDQLPTISRKELDTVIMRITDLMGARWEEQKRTSGGGGGGVGLRQPRVYTDMAGLEFETRDGVLSYEDLREFFADADADARVDLTVKALLNGVDDGTSIGRGFAAGVKVNGVTWVRIYDNGEGLNHYPVELKPRGGASIAHRHAALEALLRKKG